MVFNSRKRAARLIRVRKVRNLRYQLNGVFPVSALRSFVSL